MAVKNTRVSPDSSFESVSSPCPYDGSRPCPIHDDFAILKSESKEIDELLHNNWTEIEWLWHRVDLLTRILEEFGIDVPPMDDFPGHHGGS